MEKDIILFQGEYGANSHIACEKFYPSYEPKSVSSFGEIFDMIKNKEAKYAMIPLENSYAGRVMEIHHLIQNNDIYITAEHFLKINHNLAIKQNAKIEDIKNIYSHPQALFQCRNNIKKLNLKEFAYSNTANAAKFVSENNNIENAAICSKMASKSNNLKIINGNFEDSEDNMTLFIVISDEDRLFNLKEIKDQKIITTMLINIRNIPGSLYKVLGGFATNNINMIKLESYISTPISNQAQFFISILGHPLEKNISLALEEIGFFSKEIKFLGSYYADKYRSFNN